MLKKMTDAYHEDPKAHVAPYTSLITSSMMGKSRLMKEMSKYIPCVYICLRSGASGSSGYPQRSFRIAQWFEEPLNNIAPSLKDEVMQADFEHHLPPLKYAAFLLSLITSLAKLANTDNDDLFQHELHIERTDLRWMWEFFAEPPNISTEKQADMFWDEVISNATDIFRTQFNTYMRYITVDFRNKISARYEELESAFQRWVPDDNFTLILLFDEARRLCDISAYDGKKILGDDCYNEQGHRISVPESETAFIFSIFRALRRASRFTLLCEQKIRIFSLFTDTASRISDFQPHAAFDRSSRIFTRYPPGIKQFEPIFAFTSLDAHAQLHCNGRCLSDIHEVSDPERLIKFGRAGWYSTYVGRMKEEGYFFDMATLTMFAGNKLLCLPYDSQSDLEELVRKESARMSSTLKLKLLALLAVRLDIAAGPFTTEAGELVASHLAVLIDVKPDHSYLKTAYSSEPILAAVAARHIAHIGWHAPLKALCHYIDSAVVSSGFRGELLTKVICLITMDEVIRSADNLPKSPPNPRRQSTKASSNAEHRPPSRSADQARNFTETPPASAPEFRPTTPVTPYRWRYAQPVRVIQFLDHFLAAPRGYASFSSALTKRDDLCLNSSKLDQFLNGYVFFNHFMSLDTRLSIEIVARAWNRGVALSCKDYTKGFDYVIPVMLAQPGTETAFGPMFDPWTPQEITQGCRHFSLIFINSKNYAAATDQETSAGNNAPTETNFENKIEFDKEKNIYLSLLQDFGPIHGRDEGTVTIKPRKNTRQKRDQQQIVVILKGYDCQTYKCLGSSNSMADDNPTIPNTELLHRQRVQRAIEQLKMTIEFRDKDRSEDDRRFLAVKEGFFTLGLTQKRYREEWEEERSKFSEWKNRSGDIEMPDVEPARETKEAIVEHEDSEQMDYE